MVRSLLNGTPILQSRSGASAEVRCPNGDMTAVIPLRALDGIRSVSDFAAAPMSCWILTRPASFVLAAALLAAACGPRTAGTEPGVIPFSLVPSKVLPSSPEPLALGKQTFEK